MDHKNGKLQMTREAETRFLKSRRRKQSSEQASISLSLYVFFYNCIYLAYTNPHKSPNMWDSEKSLRIPNILLTSSQVQSVDISNDDVGCLFLSFHVSDISFDTFSYFLRRTGWLDGQHAA